MLQFWKNVKEELEYNLITQREGFLVGQTGLALQSQTSCLLLPGRLYSLEARPCAPC